MNNISVLNDKFSWARCLSIGLLYKKSLICYLAVSAILTILGIIWVELINHSRGNAIYVLGLVGFITTAIIYCSPIVFARHDDTLMTLLPVKASEKFVFYMLFSLVAVPVVVKGSWFVINFILSLINQDFDLTNIVRSSLTAAGADINDIKMDKMSIFKTVMNLGQTFSIIITCLYIVIRSRRNRAIKGIIGVIAFIFISGMIAGGYAIYIAIREYSSTPSQLSTPGFQNMIVEQMMPIMLIFNIAVFIFGLFMAYKFYQLLKTRQVTA